MLGTSLAPPTASLAQFSSQIPTIVRMIAVLKKQRSIGGIILPNVRQFILVDGVRGYFHRQETGPYREWRFEMPTAIPHPGQPARLLFKSSNVSENSNAKIGSGAALLIAWTVMMMIFAAVVPSPEPTTMDPFQLLATF
jgi:hypothetical protein